MANVYAVKSGNWSDTTVWNTGALPTSADDVWANTFTVVADTSTTVLSIRNGSTTGITAGGSFTAANGVTLTLSGAGVMAVGTCFTSNLTTGQSYLITGNVTGISGNSAAVINSNTGTLNITGNCTGGVNDGGSAVQNSSTGIVNIVGNCTGGTSGGGGAPGARNASTGTINITGSVIGGTNTSIGAVNAAAGTIQITGSCTASTVQLAVSNSSTGVINITGACTANGASAVNNSSTGSVTIIGALQATNNIAALTSTNTGALVILSGPFLVSGNGTHATNCFNWKWQNTTPTATYYQIRSANLATIRPLYTADSVGGNPAVGNVRSGTVYGPASELTGTCAVPAAGSVAFGVPVDNTTGTAVLTSADVQAALTSQGLTTTRAGYLDRLPNTSTTQEVADIIDAAI